MRDHTDERTIIARQRERKRKQKIPPLFTTPGTDTPDADLIFDATQKRVTKEKRIKKKTRAIKRNRTHQELEQVIAVFVREREKNKRSVFACVLH